MEPKRWFSDEAVISFAATLGFILGAGGCLGLALLPVLFGAADNLPPPRDAPGMAAAGAAVIGSVLGIGVGAFLGYRYTKRRETEKE